MASKDLRGPRTGRDAEGLDVLVCNHGAREKGSGVVAVTIACIIIANILLGCIGGYSEWVDQKRRFQSAVDVMRMTVPDAHAVVQSGVLVADTVSVQRINGPGGKILELKFRK